MVWADKGRLSVLSCQFSVVSSQLSVLRKDRGLPADAVDDVEPDQRGEGKGNRDGRGVYVEAKLAGRGGGCHGELLGVVNAWLGEGEDWAQMHETHAA